MLIIVEESVNAYRVCKERIDAVEKVLEKALTDVNANVTPRAASEEGVARAVPVSPSARAPALNPGITGQKPPATGFDDMDDDIAF